MLAAEYAPYIAPPRGHLSIAPLRAFTRSWIILHGATIEALAEDAGVAVRTVQRVLTDSTKLFVGVEIADRLCIAMSVHPVQLWPEEWLQ